MYAPLKYFIVLLGVGAVGASLAPLRTASAQERGFIEMQNNTRYVMTLYIDGAASCTANPNTACQVIVAAGVHNFTASDGAGHSASTRDEIVAGAGKRWTIYAETILRPQ
jgi:hypothetical protein